MSKGHYSWSNGTADKFVSQPRARNYSEKPNNLIEYHTTVHSEQIFFLFAIGLFTLSDLTLLEVCR